MFNVVLLINLIFDPMTLTPVLAHMHAPVALITNAPHASIPMHRCSQPHVILKETVYGWLSYPLLHYIH